MTAQIRILKEVAFGAERVAQGKYVLKNLHRIIAAKVECRVGDTRSLHQRRIVHKERA